MKPKLPKWTKRIELWLVFIVVLTAAIGGVAASVDSIRWWPWLSEHKALAGEVHKIDVRVLEESVKRLRLELISRRILVREMEFKQRFVPELIKDVEEMKEEYRDMKGLLKKVRGY